MAVMLVRYALAAGVMMAAATPFLEAQACACCTEQGQRHVGSEAFDEFRRAEVERVNFAPSAKAFGAGMEPDPGATALAESYEMTTAWNGDFLVFILSSPDGGKGSISLKRPAKIGVFEVDPRDTADAGMGPVLYKEWKLTGAVEATGAFAAASGEDQTATLILQGRGNSCGSAEDFKAWTLVVEGPKARFTLFGELTPPD